MDLPQPCRPLSDGTFIFSPTLRSWQTTSAQHKHTTILNLCCMCTCRQQSLTLHALFLALLISQKVIDLFNPNLGLIVVYSRIIGADTEFLAASEFRFVEKVPADSIVIGARRVFGGCGSVLSAPLWLLEGLSALDRQTLRTCTG